MKKAGESFGPRKPPPGRRRAPLSDAFRIVQMVFCERYGLSSRQQHHFPLARRPGTVDAYSIDGSPVPSAFRTVEEVCRVLEPQLKAGLLEWTRHPETGELQTWTSAALIAKRRSDCVATQGDATRQALYRALREEKRRYQEIDQRTWRDKAAGRRR